MTADELVHLLIGGFFGVVGTIVVLLLAGKLTNDRRRDGR